MTASMTVADVLRAARAKIERPECWTQNVLARNSYGVPVRPCSEKAVCWCLAGAIASATDDVWFQSYAACTLGAMLDGQDISVFNDTHTHAEVIKAFDWAIAVAEALT